MKRRLIEWFLKVTYARAGDPFFQGEQLLKNREERRELVKLGMV